MIIKDREAFEWRRAHSVQIEEQIKDFVSRARRFSDSEKTEDSWRGAIILACGSKKMLPLEILDYVRKRAEIDSEELQVAASKFIDEVVAYCQEFKYAPNSIRGYPGILRNWFSRNKIKIDDDIFEDLVRVPRAYGVTEDDILKPDELRKVLDLCKGGVRAKTLILCLVSSGLRIEEFLLLRIEDIDFSERPVKVNLRAEIAKFHQKRVTFFSDEAVGFLTQFLSGRTSGFVFLGRHQGVKPDGKTYIRGEINEDEPMSYTNAVEIYYNALNDAGLDKLDKQERHVYHLHTLRKFFKTYMSLPDAIGADMALLLMGYKKMGSVYDKYSAPMLGEIYLKGMHAVTILNRTTPQDKEKMKQIEEKAKSLENAIPFIQEKHNEQMVALQKQIDDLRRMYEGSEFLKIMREEYLEYAKLSQDPVILKRIREIEEEKITNEMEQDEIEGQEEERILHEKILREGEMKDQALNNRKKASPN